MAAESRVVAETKFVAPLLRPRITHGAWVPPRQDSSAYSSSCCMGSLKLGLNKLQQALRSNRWLKCQAAITISHRTERQPTIIEEAHALSIELEYPGHSDSGASRVLPIQYWLIASALPFSTDTSPPVSGLPQTRGQMHHPLLLVAALSLHILMIRWNLPQTQILY
jgi:hypothetical protein